MLNLGKKNFRRFSYRLFISTRTLTYRKYRFHPENYDYPLPSLLGTVLGETLLLVIACYILYFSTILWYFRFLFIFLGMSTSFTRNLSNSLNHLIENWLHGITTVLKCRQLFWDLCAWAQSVSRKSFASSHK